MKSTGRALLFYTGLSAAAVIVILVLALTLMDWNLFKRPVEGFATTHFGREVKIAGPLKARIWSRIPTVTLTGVTIANAPWEPDRPLATIKSAQIQLQLSSLLRGHLVFRRVELIEPDIYLHQEKSGRANWTSENKAPTKTRASKPTAFPALRDLVIESGKLTLIDELRRMKVNGTVQAGENSSRDDPKPFRIEGTGTINNEPFQLNIAGGPLRVLSPDRPYPFSLVITAGKNEVRSDVKVLKPFDLAQLDLQVDASGRDLADLFFLTQITLPNSPPFKLRAHIARRDMQVTVTDIAGSLGASDITGSVSIDASTKRPTVKAELLSHHLLLKDFAAVTGNKAEAAESLAPAKQAPSEKKAVAAATAHNAMFFPDAHLQVERLRAADADLQFRATSIEAGSVPFTGVSLHVKLQNSILSLEPVRFEMARGRISGDVYIDARAAPPKVRIALRAQDVRLAQFKAKGPNATPPLDGTLDARASVEGTGDSIHALVADANGTLTFVVPNGDIRSAFAELTGVDVAKGIGLLVGKADERVPLRCGVAQFDVQRGTAHAQDIVLDTQNVLITGEGQIYLGPERLDLTIQGQPKKLRVVRLRAPVEIKGQLVKPSFRLEPGHLLKQGGIAAALGTLLTPLGAVLAFVDPGLAKDENCAQLLAQAQQHARNAQDSPTARAQYHDSQN